MPIMDGYEAIKKIHSSENEKLRNIPIVAMTADVTQEDIQKTKEYGFSSHLAKPLSSSLFYKTILEQICTRSIDSIKKNKDTILQIEYKNIDYRLSKIPQLKYEETLYSMSNNNILYHTLIKDFIILYSDATDKIRHFIIHKEFERGEYYTHLLKEGAANIGAVNIYKEAKIIEKCFRTEDVAILSLRIKKLFKSIDYFFNIMNNIVDINDKKLDDFKIDANLNILLSDLLQSAKVSDILKAKRIAKEIHNHKWPRMHTHMIYRTLNSLNEYHLSKVIQQLEIMGIS